MKQERTITVHIGNKTFTFPTDMAILARAEDFHGMSTTDAMGGDKPLSAPFVIGVICAGIERATGKAVPEGKEKERMDTIGRSIDWTAINGIFFAFAKAFSPDVELPAEDTTKAGNEVSTDGKTSSG